MQAAVAVVEAEADVTPRVAEVDLVLGPVAMLVLEPDAVVAEPMEAVAGILAELVEPRAVVLGVVAPIVVDAEHPFLVVESMKPGVAAALPLEVDPKFAEGVTAHRIVSRRTEPVAETVVALEVGSRMAEHLSGPVPAPEVDSRMAEFEESMYLWRAEAVLVPEKADVSPKVAVVGTDLGVAPGAALEMDARNW